MAPPGCTPHPHHNQQTTALARVELTGGLCGGHAFNRGEFDFYGVFGCSCFASPCEAVVALLMPLLVAKAAVTHVCRALIADAVVALVGGALVLTSENPRFEFHSPHLHSTHHPLPR